MCGAFGLLVLGAAVREAVIVRRLHRDGIRTQGLVVRQKAPADSDSTYWVPVIAFVDQQGHRVEFSPTVEGTRMGLATGVEVPVVYDRRNPQSARVLKYRYMTGAVLVAALAKVAVGGASVLIALKN
ncbi:DUF3592 domain-containing protein [Streptomyces sp. NPDC007971]|uniref:DUF3592 domain-containing protein n=1 Tax=Streptomyces sp. NPDC007971 TaxID=3364799 RepID=UPI0036E13A93